MQTGRRLHRYTYADYCGIERYSPTQKHEFLDGEIYAMAGGSEDHSRLASEVLRTLGNALVDGPCQTWVTRVAIASGKVDVASVGAVLVVDEIYRRSPVA